MMSRVLVIKLEANKVHTICGYTNNCGDECSYGVDLGSVLEQISTGPGDNVIEYLQHGRITINISFKAAKITFGFGNWKSNPRPIGNYCQPAAVMLEHNFRTPHCCVDL
ncbi:hypothetical protein FEM48_Zijuj02G0037000 [Ziziphus jujuba var. spinosa]|uniref:Uncharacterized protein n=1 Tax=Ziziphus jujuba var. spinosa TaxID=714518 RepID=A0A978VTF1_ZIZJJ|nr:hypothetical protein FEM48_Zijuj02G0037000 [Ziziphus jujuba var. spinosa]